MPKTKKTEKQIDFTETKSDSLWRKPIALDASESEDPLATLYQGRESAKSADSVKIELTKAVKREDKLNKKPAITLGNAPNAKKSARKPAKNEPENQTDGSENTTEEPKAISGAKLTESELKKILRIKDEVFHFTDIREILRGKSLDIYSYLRVLSGEKGACKIKHLDLMSRLDISRPTLFKQQDWLTRLGLIEKRSVPGDHLGTSYKINRLEDVLPLPEILIEQLETKIENITQAVENR